MILTAKQAARDYLEDAACRRVLAISPRTLSARLGCSDEQSLAILKSLANDGLGEFRGYVVCQGCRETVPLKSTGLSDLYREASEVVGTHCRYCDDTLAGGPDDVEVQLSFFLAAVTGPAVTAPEQLSAGDPQQSLVSLSALKAADKMNIQNLIVVQNGGSLRMQNLGDLNDNANQRTGDITSNVVGGNQQTSGRDQNITGRGNISVGKSDTGPNWFTKGLVLKILGVVGAVIGALVVFWVKGKLGTTRP